MSFLNRYFDEIEVGEKLISRGRPITETDIVQRLKTRTRGKPEPFLPALLPGRIDFRDVFQVYGMHKEEAAGGISN